jgi:hypothetical protein
MSWLLVVGKGGKIGKKRRAAGMQMLFYHKDTKDTKEHKEEYRDAAWNSIILTSSS